jgi:hypothetical protein
MDRMKKILFIAICGTVLISCDKKIPAPPSFISATINGTGYTVNQQMTIARLRQPNDSTESFSIYGIDGNANYLEVDLLSKNNLKDSTYIFAKDSSQLIKVVFQPAGGDSYSTAYTAANPSSITITYVDTVSTIRGTFTGVLYENGDTTQSSKTITNGNFTLMN